MGKLREQLHEETMKLEMANWIKERNLKSNVPKGGYERGQDETKPIVNPF